MKSNLFFIKGTIAVLLLCGCVFLGCAEANGDNATASRNGSDVPEKPWIIEGYPREMGTFEGLDAELEWRILKDYYNTFFHLPQTFNDHYVYKYHGTHKGFYAVTILCAPLDKYIFKDNYNEVYQINGIKFPWYTWYDVWFWKDGMFNHLVELYVSGEFLWDDLLIIASWGEK